MPQDTRSVAEQFKRQAELARDSVHGLTDEETVRQVVRDELERLIGHALKGLSE